MKLTPFILALTVGLTGCPESPEDLEKGNDQGASNNPQPGTPSDGSNDGPVAEPGVLIDANSDKPKHDQADLEKDPEAVKISGTIRCADGKGPYRIRVFVPPPSEGGPQQDKEGEPPGPLAAKNFKDAGAFEMYTPKGAALKLLAYEDSMEPYEVPTPEETQFGTVDGKVLDFSTPVSDLMLDCTAALPVPQPIAVNTEEAPTPSPPPEGMPGGDAPVPGGEAPVPGGEAPVPGGNAPVPGGEAPTAPTPPDEK